MGFLLDTTRPCGGGVRAAARAAPPRSPGREACLATRGFTLLELIAVIAIIAMLPAIVYPIYNRARESGRRALCMSNLKQLVAAVQMYAADNDGGIPIGPNAPTMEHRGRCWCVLRTPATPPMFSLARATLAATPATSTMRMSNSSIGMASGSLFGSSQLVHY